MNKKIKYVFFGIILLFIFGLSFIIISSYYEHQNLINEEKEMFPALGNLVDIYDNNETIHLYSQGKGNKTLVFLSGFGTPSPLYDFKTLYEKLSNDYKTVVVERFGYGYSDINSNPREIETILNETRIALKESNYLPPYVLIPHSMSGLEAIYWGNQYPDEINTIIGLDTLIPNYFLETKEEVSISWIVTFLARSGLMRNQPNVCYDNFLAVQKGNLSEEDKKIACSIFFRRVNTKNMQNEANMISRNSEIVNQNDNLSSSFNVFISNEADDLWKETLINYSKNTNGKYYLLNASHYVHLDKPNFISHKIKMILEK